MKLWKFACTVAFSVLLCSTSLFAESKVHTVQKGETFYSISKKYNLSVKELLDLNNLTDTAILKVGDSLIIEKEAVVQPEKYTVGKGDTMYSIARKNNITVTELQKLNNLDNESVLKVGQVLLIPGTIETTSTVTKNNTSSESSTTIAKTTEDPRTYDSKKKGDVTLIWPVQAKEITYVTGKISGVSITATKKNETVTAIRAGTVMSCSTYRGFGQVVFVQASSGHIYVYSGMDSITVKQGQQVNYGDSLGTCGTDALSGKHSISLMVYQNGKVLDPAKAPRG